MSQIARDYFIQFFSSRSNDSIRILFGIRRCIDSTTNDRLLMNFSKEEVETAIKNMGSTKASEEDGFPALFFQKFWHIVVYEVTQFCLDVLNQKKSVASVNNTEIVPLPKTLNLIIMAEFCPISLCTRINKIIAKSIANRFQKVIGNRIDEA